MSQNISSAVMAQRREPPDSLDFFPTPPWATRALCEIIDLSNAHVWEPAAGEGHMAEVLREYAASVFASDVHVYGYRLDACGSFTGAGLDVVASPRKVDWIITNPPFNLAEAFLQRALDEAHGVAFFVRTQWLETEARHREVFSKTPPDLVALFAERVALIKGRWDPQASTATSYCWCVWRPGVFAKETRLIWIAPGRKRALTRADDARRFAREAAA